MILDLVFFRIQRSQILFLNSLISQQTVKGFKIFLESSTIINFSSFSLTLSISDESVFKTEDTEKETQKNFFFQFFLIFL